MNREQAIKAVSDKIGLSGPFTDNLVDAMAAVGVLKLEEPSITKEQIKHMVDRFLGWKLPANFHPDGGISFKPYGNEGTAHQYRHDPSGTNLFDAVQAEAMVRHMVDGLPPLKLEEPVRRK